jgi:hypothetical protein
MGVIGGIGIMVLQRDKIIYHAAKWFAQSLTPACHTVSRMRVKAGYLISALLAEEPFQYILIGIGLRPAAMSNSGIFCVFNLAAAFLESFDHIS